MTLMRLVAQTFYPPPVPSPHILVCRFARIMAKSFEYMEEFELEGFEEQVLAPLRVVDVLRCTVIVPSAQRLLEVREAVTTALPNARTKNGYSQKAIAACGYRDMKLNVLFQCGAFGSLISEVQLMLNVSAELKGKMHVVYQVIRGGPFSPYPVSNKPH